MADAENKDRNYSFICDLLLSFNFWQVAGHTIKHYYQCEYIFLF